MIGLAGACRKGRAFSAAAVKGDAKRLALTLRSANKLA